MNHMKREEKHLGRSVICDVCDLITCKKICHYMHNSVGGGVLAS